MPFLETVDLVGQLSLADIIAEQPGCRALLEESIETTQNCRRSLFRDFRLDDDVQFVLPHA